MKTKALLIMTVFLLSISCEKQVPNPDVDIYIRQLIAGQYTPDELPAFTPSDIPALLYYRNETNTITNFPHNPISSLWGPECKLGIYVLWTIESIRAVEINSKYLIGRFPSQNPILALRNATQLALVSDEDSQKVVAKAYYDWWNSVHILSDKMNIDPLAGTPYKWH
jgi:hypothetical protein